MRDIAAAAVERWPIGRPFPIHPEMQGVTLDVILRTVFGLDEGPRLSATCAPLCSHLLAIGSNRAALLAPRSRRTATRAGPARAVLRSARRAWTGMLFAEIAAAPADRRDVARPRPTSSPCCSQARYEDGAPLDDQALRDELMTMLLAGPRDHGHRAGLGGDHVLERPRRARAALLRRARRGRAPLDPQQVTKLDYLDAVCSETLRLTPIVPLVGRRLTRPMTIGGIDLPAGVVAAPCIYLAHRRPDAGPSPSASGPSASSSAKPTPYEFLPFGGGVRRCLGMAFALVEMKIVLAEVLSRVELRAAPGYQVRVVRRSVTLAPSEGMPVVVERRAA